MKRFFAILTLAVSVAFGARAVDITLTQPGTLASQIGQETSASTLKVTGPIDVRDIDFIADKMTSLTSLDLSAATVRAYDGKRKGSSQTNFLADELPTMSFAGMKLTSIKLPATLKTIGDGAFALTSITGIEIPSSVSEIRSGAFSNCPQLKSIVIPATVVTAGHALFRDCPALTDATFMPSRLGARTFAGCQALKNVALGNDVTSIGEGAFADCVSLTTVSYSGSSLREIGDYAFYHTGLKTLNLAGGNDEITTIGAWAFAENSSLTKLELAPRVYSLGEGAFFNDGALQTFSSPVGYTTVGDLAFSGASSLNATNVLSETTRTIGRYALTDMESMQYVILPPALTRIGEHAFEGWTGLREMNAPSIETVPALGDDVWNGLDKSKIALAVPEKLIDSFKNADQWKEFNIRNASDDTTMGDNILADDFAISARFDGQVIMVSGNDNLSSVEVYDTLGRLLTSVAANGTDHVAIDTSRWSTRVYIVRAISSDGLTASVKTAR